jgi:DNA repair protein SbcD/Mre11
MKILHTADWHLGKRLESFSRLEEQKEVLQEICEIAEQENPDLIIIAGDLFDNYNPSSEAVDLFYKTLKKLSSNGRRPVFAIAGNHDSPERIEVPDPLARECGIFFAGFPDTIIRPCQLESGVQIVNAEPGFAEVSLPGYSYNLRLLLTPYANEVRLRTCFDSDLKEEEMRLLLQNHWQNLADKYCDDNGVNLLAAHLFVAEENQPQEEEPDDEKSIVQVGGAQVIFTRNIPEQIQYTALGHLHRFIRMGSSEKPVIYSSSPLAYSFSEAEQDKYVVMINAEPAQPVRYEKILLKKGRRLLRRRFENFEDCLEWLNNNKDVLLELTLVADEFLSGMQRRQLFETHDGIVTIIPEIRNTGAADRKTQAEIDPARDMEDLFDDYFLHRLGQHPDDEIKKLFREILNRVDE